MDIRSGELPAGTRLPTQRDLAYRLGVTVGTVGRAYDIAARAGLVAGETGRGTYVRGSTDDRQKNGEPPVFESVGRLTDTPGSKNIPMRGNQPANVGQGDAIADATRGVLDHGATGHLHRYVGHDGSGSPANRLAGCKWIARAGIETDVEHVIMTPGAQNAIATAIIAGSRPDDLIIAGELTYPSVSDLSRSLDRRLMGIAIDEDGICPDAFESVCREHAPSLLFDVPTLHNPTCSTMSDERRNRIVSIARQYGVRIIEDDIYASILEADQRPTALAALYPEGTFFISGLSKAVAPGLRAGFLVAPSSLAGRTRAVHYNLTLGCAPLIADIAGEMIMSGTAATLAKRQREEIVRRKAVAQSVLAGAQYITADGGLHLWLTVPAPWRASTFAQAALNRGVTIGTADEFMVDQNTTAVHKVRICLGTPEHIDQVQRGLAILADLLARGPADVTSTV